VSPTKAKAKPTAAQRARARRDPAVGLPPAPPKTERDSNGLHLRTAKAKYLMGPRLSREGCDVELTMDGASALTLTVDDQDSRVLEALSDETQRLVDGARVIVDDVVYVLSRVSCGENRLLTLSFEDEVAWRLRLWSRYVSKSRARTTRAEFVRFLVDEASNGPRLPMRAFIPELTDRRPISSPARERRPVADPPKRTSRKTPAARVRRGEPARGRGTGDGAGYTVQGQKASAQQRQVIDGCLAEADRLGASRMVLIATVMCITQESGAGRLANVQTGNDDVGIFQQGRNWISVAGSKQPAASTKAFLVTGPSSWKKVHGSLKRVPGGYEAALKRVQISVGGYAKWEGEATRTVDAWLAQGGGGGASSDESGGSGRTTAVPYLFERGSRDGAREDSWTATGRLAEQVGFRRWAALNTLFFVSDRELRAAAPSLEIHGDEGFMLSSPTWDWGVTRPSQEVTFRVLSERWGILPGAVVVMSSQGALNGRYLVASVRDDLFSPESEVTLRRPVEPRPEPAHETRTSSDSAGGGSRDGRAIAGSPIPGTGPKSSTHETGGLPGYPAFDYMAPAGSPCVAPVSGTVTKISGTNPAAGPPQGPGGPLGYSVYISGGGKSYYLTHMGRRTVKVGDRVTQGEKIGTVANYAKFGRPDHIHQGVRG